MYLLNVVFGGSNYHFKKTTGPLSVVGCESDCRSRGPEFDSGRVPYFHGD